MVKPKNSIIGCPRIESACNRAAYYGQLEVLDYLHKNGCSWSESTYCSAIRLSFENS